MNGSPETLQSDAVEKWKQHRLFVAPLDVARAHAWIDVLGSHVLPVTSREPVEATEGPFKGKRFYLMAYPELLTPEDRDELLTHAVRQFGLSLAEAEQELDKYGVPLLAERLIIFETESDAHRQNPEQFAPETTEEDLKQWLEKDLARVARLERLSYKGDPVATAEYEMVRATADQLRAELRYLEEVKQRETKEKAAAPSVADSTPA